MRTMPRTILAFMAVATASVFPAHADQQSIEGRYRGMIVCEKMPATPDILHVPLDLVVRGGNVQFARPTFNLRGTRVTGSELDSGTVGVDGKLQLTSEWNFRSVDFQGEYLGTLTATGGTMTGTQTWHGPNGIAGNRHCQAALVPTPRADHTASDQ
jgi:hypothetical protein